MKHAKQPAQLQRNGVQLQSTAAARATSDSGLESIGGDGACPVLDLIFDPDLNAYYHPSTQEYYQVTAAGY